MEEVLAFQVQAPSGRKSLRARERRRPPRVRAPQPIELGAIALVGERRPPARLELVEGGNEGLRDVAASVGAVETRRRHRAAATYARTRA